LNAMEFVIDVANSLTQNHFNTCAQNPGQKLSNRSATQANEQI